MGQPFFGARVNGAIPRPEQLAAMELAAWRDDKDIADAESLLRALAGKDREAAKGQIEPFVVAGTNSRRGTPLRRCGRQYMVTMLVIATCFIASARQQRNDTQDPGLWASTYIASARV